MKKFLSILAVASTAMYFTSCSKSDDVGADVDHGTTQPVEIKVGGRTMSITPGPNTRAPFENDGTSYPLVARVLASNATKNYDGANLIKDGTMTFTAASTSTGFDTPTGGVKYPTATGNVYLVGLYPTAPEADDWTIDTGSKASYSFNGSQDVMATNEVTTTRSDVIDDKYKILTFHHLLTRLNLTIQSSDQTAKDLWGDVTSIKVKSPNDGVTVTFKTEDTNVPTYTFTSTETLPDMPIFSFYKTGGNTVVGTMDIPLETSNPAPTAQSYSLVAPKNEATQVSYDLIVTTVNHPAEYAINVPLFTAASTPAAFTGDTQGKQFNITLTFSTTEIKAKAIVKPWGDGGTGGATIQ